MPKIDISEFTSTDLSPAELLRMIASEVGDLVVEKREAYGDSLDGVGEFLRLLWPAGIPVEQYTDAALLTRVWDKCKRIAHRKDAFGESPYRDLAGYSIRGAARDEAARRGESAARLREAVAGGAAAPEADAENFVAPVPEEG